MVKRELSKWKRKMKKRPTFVESGIKNVQMSLNNILPEKYHDIVTSAIKNMTKVVLIGSQYTTSPPYSNLTLHEREYLVEQKIKKYKTTAMLEGAGTGAGGIVLGLADLPLLLSIKMKLLYDIASIYGFDIRDYRERVYILYIFQLAFSSKSNVNKVFDKMESFNEYYNQLPDDINAFDWRTFQQEYRDYIDLAKLMQMLPGVGAAVGAYVNNKLVKKLGETAIMAYRMRLLN